MGRAAGGRGMAAGTSCRIGGGTVPGGTGGGGMNAGIGWGAFAADEKCGMRGGRPREGSYRPEPIILMKFPIILYQIFHEMSLLFLEIQPIIPILCCRLPMIKVLHMHKSRHTLHSLRYIHVSDHCIAT